jgi:hypothetical protein
MSIRDEITDRVRRGMLHPLLPQAAGAAPRRAMFVSEGLWHALTSPEGDDEWERRVGELRADLELFVAGEPVHPKYLFLLYPACDAVWEVRSTGTDPSIRVLGLFAEKDVYIATNYAHREWLGGWQSREWKRFKRMAKAIWLWLFPTHQPIVTSKVSDLVTGAIDGRYFKERA